MPEEEEVELFEFQEQAQPPPDQGPPGGGGFPVGRGPHGGGFPGGFGGFGGPPGGGGFPTPPPVPPNVPQQPHQTDKFIGNALVIFTGDRTKTEEFSTQWELYWGVQKNTSIRSNVSRRAMFFLTYIQGPLVNEWVVALSRWLNRQIQNGVPDTQEDLWTEVARAFMRRFANTLEKERAQAELKRGIKMKDGDIDMYVAHFEQLARKAGYRLNTPQTLDLFTDGLPKDLYEKVYQVDKPRKYDEWKNTNMPLQEQYNHIKAKLDLHRPQNASPRPLPGRGTWTPRGGGWTPSRNIVPRYPRDPNAMDTSADHTRVRLANAEYVLARDQQRNPRPTFPPRGGAVGIRRGLRQDLREDTCY